jgi:hypothetical protein
MFDAWITDGVRRKDGNAMLKRMFATDVLPAIGTVAIKDVTEHHLPEVKAVENYPMKWVKLERYAEISGDTVNAVQARSRTGKWLNGRECKLIDGRVWINLPAVEQWVEKWK